MMNLQLVEDQPRWRVAVVVYFAKLMGVCIHVEGLPFGSIRSRKHPPKTMGEKATEELRAQKVHQQIGKRKAGYP